MLSIHEDADRLYCLSPRVFHSYCFYCGIGVTSKLSLDDRRSRNFKTRDHIYPASLIQDPNQRWFLYHPEDGKKILNWVTACYYCNSCKGSKSMEDWRIIFFGIHGGKFWGERFLDDSNSVEFLAEDADYQKILPPIPEAS